jgi:hypothetical protein
MLIQRKLMHHDSIRGVGREPLGLNPEPLINQKYHGGIARVRSLLILGARAPLLSYFALRKSGEAHQKTIDAFASLGKTV